MNWQYVAIYILLGVVILVIIRHIFKNRKNKGGGCDGCDANCALKTKK